MTADDSSTRLAAVHDQIAKAAKLAGREPEAVTLIAVSKTHPAEAIRPLIAAGQRVFGENRVQEAEAKWRAESDVALALATARCEAAEAALATAGPSALIGERDAEITHLRDEIARQARMAEADMAAAKAAADIAAGEKLKAGQAIWEQETSAALAKANARAEAAETALDVERRFFQHACGLGAKFTRARPPVRLLAVREYPSKGDALRAELQLKALPRVRKLGFFDEGAANA